MISISLLIEFLLATVISSIMYVAITWTNGNFIKNVLIYSVLNIIILIINVTFTILLKDIILHE